MSINNEHEKSISYGKQIMDILRFIYSFRRFVPHLPAVDISTQFPQAVRRFSICQQVFIAVSSGFDRSLARLLHQIR